MPGAPRDPRSLDERLGVANECASSLDLTMPFLVDDMKDTANRGYAAWPDRLYVIGASGKVIYKAGRGPWGFKPEEARKALDLALPW